MNFLGILMPWPVALFLIMLILTIIALVEIIKGNLKDSDKIIWVAVILFLNFLGTILYFAIGRKRRLNN